MRASSLAFAAADLAPSAGEEVPLPPPPPGEGVFFFCGVADLRVGFGLVVVGVDGDMSEEESTPPI